VTPRERARDRKPAPLARVAESSRQGGGGTAITLRGFATSTRERFTLRGPELRTVELIAERLLAGALRGRHEEVEP